MGNSQSGKSKKNSSEEEKIESKILKNSRNCFGLDLLSCSDHINHIYKEDLVFEELLSKKNSCQNFSECEPNNPSINESFISAMLPKFGNDREIQSWKIKNLFSEVVYSEILDQSIEICEIPDECNDSDI